MRRIASAFLLVAGLVAGVGTASADTTIAGGNLPGASNTWTLAGSPYILQGDTTVPAGATLTIEAGVEVRAAASTDGQLSGLNTSRVELTIAGTLHVQGTAAKPVTFKASSPVAGSWYGLVVGTTATDIQLAYLDVQGGIYGITSQAAGTELHTSHVSISSSSSYGLWLREGSPTLDTVTATTSGNYGIAVTDNASPTLTSCVLRGNGSMGMYIAHGSAGRSVALTNCTINANATYGIYSGANTANAASISVTSSIITNHAYGVYRADSATWSVTYSNVWNNTSGNYVSIAAGTGTISANPLYVSSADLRLTSNSPSRFGGAASSDQGALPYDTVATPGLYGVLWTNTSLTVAGSPYTVGGDLTVAPGVTLTVDPGVTLNFASVADIMASGINTSRGELIVRGKIVADGTAAQPITFATPGNVAGNWYGVQLEGAVGGSVLDNVNIRNAIYGLTYNTNAVNTVSHVTAELSSSYGFWLRAGSQTFDTLTATTSGNYGVAVTDDASPTLTSCVLRGNGSMGMYIAHGSAGRSVTLSNCTVNANATYGIYSGANTANAASISVTSSIITNHAYGVYRADSATWSVTYSNVWNNTSGNYVSIAAGTGTISANPLYVSSADLRLTSNSPSRFGGAASSDQGALPYDTVATPGLYGVLWTNTSLTMAGSPYTVGGDLTVPAGVTLTVDPGVTLNFASVADIMASGINTSRGELIVRGKLVADGTPGMPITFATPGNVAGNWYGVQLEGSSAASTLDNVNIRNAIYGLTYNTTGSGNTLSRITAELSSSYGFWFRAGSPAGDGLIALTSGNYGYALTDNANLTLTNCIARTNGSMGIYVAHGSAGHSLAVTNCTINGNATYGIYSGANTANAASISVTNSIITNHAYGVYRADSANWSVTYSDVWNNTSGNYVSVAAGTGTLSANPLYISSADLRVQGTSVVIDAGTTGPNHDLEGVTRPIDGNGLGGAQYDMGAYEFVLAPQCGNGATEPGEACDSGANNGMYGYCKADCSGQGPRCGDGATNGPEQCDDGNASDTDACTTTCHTATCGDGFVYGGVEQCDDANASNTDACTNQCKVATCGDGYTRAGTEECDDGNQIDTDACLHTCVAATCGDGVIRAGVETCDDGNTVNTDACTNACATAACGDGIVRAGVEECDDSNTIDTDACTASCKVATCGDGSVRAGVEECDDGNPVDTDACRTSCLSAKCGDGVVQAGVEGCDDGNMTNTDTCNNQCVSTSCGDGVVQPGVEDCDDANQVQTDGCRNNCVKAACGDGIVYDGVEDCDDGNVKAGDGCSPACRVEDTTMDPMDPMGMDSSGGCCQSSPGAGIGSMLMSLLVLGMVIGRRRRPA